MNKTSTSAVSFNLKDKDTKKIVFQTRLTGILAEIYRYELFMFSSVFLKYPDFDQKELIQFVFNPLFYKDYLKNNNLINELADENK